MALRALIGPRSGDAVRCSWCWPTPRPRARKFPCDRAVVPVNWVNRGKCWQGVFASAKIDRPLRCRKD